MGDFSSNNRHIFKKISDDTKEIYQLGSLFHLVYFN